MEIVRELTQGQELARQLEARLDSATSIELYRSLAQELLSSIEKAICLAQSRALDAAPPRCFTGSPCSESSEQPFKVEERREMSKKRKAQPKLTSHVRLGSGPGADGPLDDGYSWRKYGQKEILGAKHPRGYYRCTHRNSQGCLAMKQVQRSEENPTVFDVTYRGTHTCQRKSPPLTTATEPDYHKNQHLLLSFQTNLKVKTENLNSKNQEIATSSSFSFPSTPVDNNVKPENHIFSPSSTLDNCFKSSFSTPFVSPATSESNYFSMSPCRMSGYGGGGANLQAPESDFTEIVSAATSVTNSPDIDFLLESVELDADFPFDISSFFS